MTGITQTTDGCVVWPYPSLATPHAMVACLNRPVHVTAQTCATYGRPHYTRDLLVDGVHCIGYNKADRLRFYWMQWTQSTIPETQVADSGNTLLTIRAGSKQALTSARNNMYVIWPRISCINYKEIAGNWVYHIGEYISVLFASKHRWLQFAFVQAVFTPQPWRAPGYCRTPSGRAGGRADKPR